MLHRRVHPPGLHRQLGRRRRDPVPVPRQRLLHRGRLGAEPAPATAAAGRDQADHRRRATRSPWAERRRRPARRLDGCLAGPATATAPRPGRSRPSRASTGSATPRGRVIYVGKAKSLRAAAVVVLPGHRQPAPAHRARWSPPAPASSGPWSSTEVEALQLEYSWIKEFDPRFNVKYRDDKSYPWLAVTVGEEFPRVMVGRGAKRKGIRYFGPYSHAWAIRETVDLLLRVFPMRTCQPASSSGGARSAGPACSATSTSARRPCVGRVSAEEHRAIVDDFCDFMAGNTDAFIRRIEQRDVRRLRGAGLRAGRPAARRPRGARAGAGEAGRRARRRHRRRRDRPRRGPARGRRAGLPRPRRPDPRPARLGGRPGRGGRHRRAGRATSCSSSTAASRRRRSRARCWCRRCRPTPTRSRRCSASCAGSRVRDPGAAARRQAKRCMETVARNAGQALALHKTKRASDLTTRNRALEEIQEALDLDEAPLRIECYDVSHLQGTEVVASMVVFEDGLPRKSEYRRFVIRGVDGQNDVAAMHEVITRRFRRLLDEQARSTEVGRPTSGPMLVDPETGRPRKFAYAPGLVVVDGGPPQVAAAQRALDELGIDDIAVVRAGQAARGGLAARRGGPGDPAAHQRGPLPAAAGPRRGPPVRHHLPPHAAVARRWSRACSTTSRAWARCAARRCSSTSARCKQAARRHRRRDRRGARHRPAHGRGHQGCGRPTRRAARLLVRVNTATGEIRGGLMSRSSPDGAGELVIVTGMTGAGRSTAAKELEDLGWFVVDNLPPGAAARRGAPGRREPAARSSRSRSWSTSAPARSSTRLQRQPGPRRRPAATRRCCSSTPTDEVLVRRQEAARRPHPLQGSGRLLDGMRREREVLRRPARRRRPGHRHLQPQRPPADRPGSREPFGDADATGLRDHRGQLRLQVRHPGRRRLRGRHAVPAQPVLGPRAAAA